MIKVRKGNVVYRIYDESKVNLYTQDGFKVIEKKRLNPLKAEAPKTEEPEKEDAEEQPKGKRR